MNISEFEMNVMRVLIAGDPEERTLSEQLAKATVSKREYTGVGLFTTFSIPEDVPRLRATHRLIEDTPKVHLSHPKVKSGAGALLWFADGKIATLECYTYDGKWPDNEDEFKIEEAEPPLAPDWAKPPVR